MSKAKRIINYFLIFIFCVIFFTINWVSFSYDSISFEEILYHLNPNLINSGTSVIMNYVIFAFLPALFSTFIIIYFLKKIYAKYINYALYINIKIRNKKKKFCFKKEKLVKLLNFFVFFIIFLIFIFSINKIGFFDYVKSNLNKSNFIETNYVDPKKVKLEFPLEKRNLIYIFVESLESSYFNSDIMVAHEENILEGLKELTDNNIYFSNTESYGGAIQINGLGWTTAGMIAQTSGIPTKIPGLISNESSLKSIVPGCYSIGDILEKEGYNQMLMLGSDADFGNRGIYFKSHGNYKIYDLDYARKNKKIPKNYYKWWGFEDSKLFKFAEKEILKLAESDQPFNFTMITANTHFPDGLTEKSCKSNYDVLYSNSLYCSANQINEFINWVKEQDFYDNTTIVIAGDHLTMQAGYFYEPAESNKRNVYNLFINSSLEDSNSKNRQFTTMDLYPTTLASLGVKIDGDKLGLGVNLFSEEETIIEKYGREKADTEISKVSKFYNDKILK